MGLGVARRFDDLGGDGSDACIYEFLVRNGMTLK